MPRPPRCFLGTLVDRCPDRLDRCCRRSPSFPRFLPIASQLSYRSCLQPRGSCPWAHRIRSDSISDDETRLLIFFGVRGPPNQATLSTLCFLEIYIGGEKEFSISAPADQV